MNITDKLFELQDLKYKEFQIKLTPTVSPDLFIGIRVPMLRKLAKELNGTPEAEEFLNTLPHKYYDENNLHGFLLCLIKDYDRAVSAVDEFLPYVDNWATCDLLSPKIFAKHKAELYEKIKEWISSDETYTVRFGIEMLMSHFLDGDYKPETLELVAGVHSEEYYVRMMVAWYFATALAKQYEDAIVYIEKGALGKWEHNKTIQKAIESYRISDEQKTYLRSLRKAKPI